MQGVGREIFLIKKKSRKWQGKSEEAEKMKQIVH